MAIIKFLLPSTVPQYSGAIGERGWRLMIFCARDARREKPLVARAEWKINQAPSLEGGKGLVRERE
jgi:hypothetical protein